ncbi:MAG: ATP-binding protein [bacterium]
MNELVSAKISKIKSSGAIVILPNDEEAWIPAIEFSSKYEPSKDFDLQGLCEENDIVNVIVYGKEIGGNKKLVSVLRRINDAWSNIDSWEDGEIKQLKINSVTNNYAFGYIDEGIEGVINLSYFYKNIKFPHSWENLKFINNGDTVAGYFYKRNVNIDNRIIELDILNYIKNNVNISNFLSLFSGRNFINFIDTLFFTENEATFNYDNITSVVIFEDNKNFAYDLKNYLNTLGISTEIAVINDQIDQIVILLNEYNFDLALIDVNLEQEQYCGLDIVNLIEEHQPNCKRIVFTSDDKTILSQINRYGDITISEFVFKPFGPLEFRKSLHNASKNSPKELKLFFGFEKKESSKKQKLIPQNLQTNSSAFDNLFKKITKEINADIILLFQMHPISYEINIIGKYGDCQNIIRFKNKLRYSPVKDVAVDREDIFENEISTNKYKLAKHRWLLNAVMYESCIGLPLNVSAEYMYAFFALGNKKYQFDKNSYKIFELAAMILEKHLESIKLESFIKKDNPFIIAGKTYGKMGHELMNFLPQEFKISQIINSLSNYNNNIKVIDDQIKELNELDNSLKKAKEIVNNFRNITRGQQSYPEVFNVIVCIKQLVNNIRKDLEIQDITIQLTQKFGDEEKYLRINRTAFEQVIFNIVQNAIQQINMFKFARKSGTILIELDSYISNGVEYLKILIHDTGPGIHAIYLNKIFEMGYSTRDDGSGLGLNICKDIVEKYGGYIKCANSLLFVGCTFEIIFPFVKNTGK